MWLMIFGAVAGLAVVGVAAWARASHRRVEAEKTERREKARLQLEEATLLARLRREQEDE